MALGMRRRSCDDCHGGDTHDFEYYRVSNSSTRPMHYFVNGGGGAYLSIGTAFDWPKQPGAVRSWAFYPMLADIKNKLDSETPLWKRPFHRPARSRHWQFKRA
jgi:hypothetical protein